MAKTKSKRKHLTPAAGYLRRSTGKQEMSLSDQRREIERLACENGYKIVRWYQDDSISGDATEKRSGFLRMHGDATNGRDFEVILVWDQDRFGRFNSLEAGYWVHPLVNAGVRLVTVTEGPINWNDFTGRLMYGIKQEGKHQFLHDLSRNTARGQITSVLNGWLTGRAAPYGYDRMLVDEHGEHRQRVYNGEKYAKPRSWHVTLVPSDDPQKVATAKWMFENYANTDIGLRAMADELNSKGIPGPGGGTWWIGTIREILKNETYAGDFIWPKRNLGKYNRISGQEIKARNGDVSSVKFTDEAERIEQADIFPALVDRKTFARVQEKLSQRNRQTTTRRSKHGDNYILTGLLFCGHCGAKMYGARKTRRKNGKSYVWENYVCSTYHTQGKTQCGHHKIDQHDLLSFLLRTLRDAVLAGGEKETLRERVRERLESRQQADPSDLKSLRRKVAELDKEIQHGTKRLLRAPDDIADLLGQELSTMRRERDRLTRELEEMDQAAPADVDAEVDATVDRLWAMADELDKAEPARLRELVRRMVDRIDLWFDRQERGKRTFHPFRKGTIDLRPDPLIFNTVSRGDWI